MPKKCILNKTNVVCEHCILICFHFDIYLFFLAKIILILSLSLFVSECLSNGDFSLYVDEWLLVYVIISLNMLDIVPSFICGFLTSDSMFDSQNVFLSFFLVLCLFYLDYIQRWSWFGHLISIILSKERKTHIYQATATCIRMIRIYEDAIIYVYTYSGDSQIRGKHKNWMKTPQFMNGTKSRIASFCLPCSNQAFVWCVHFLLNNR